MTEDHERNENRPASTRIHPKNFDVVLFSIAFLVSIVILTIGRWNILQKKQYFIAFSFLVCCIPVYVCLFRRVSVDSRKLKYYILGLIPVEIYWYDVAQIGTAFISSKYPERERYWRTGRNVRPSSEAVQEVRGRFQNDSLVAYST